MTHPHHAPHHAGIKAPLSPYVEVTIVFRDVLQKPIEGLSVQFKAGTGVPAAPAWKIGLDTDSSVSTSVSTSSTSAVIANSIQGSTDKDGYGVTIRNAARSQPIDVLVKNQRGEYALKATVTPGKDISAFTIVSPEYHLEATTKLTPKEALEQNVDIPVVKEGEIMTIERLVKEFGPYIGWSQKVTEQGMIKKDTPTSKKEVTVDEQTHKNKTTVSIEHHYKVIDNGKPRTVVLNVLGSRLNYPTPSTFSEDQYKDMAAQLDVDVAAVKAIVMQESSGHAFMENGLPTILYERRHFYHFATVKQAALMKKTASKESLQRDKKIKNSQPTNPYPNFPDLCFPTGDKYGPAGLHQYEKLIRASNLDFESALKSCSWGGFQILGEYYASCGCETIFEFVNKFLSGTNGQAQIFVSFMSNMKPAGVKGLRDRKWEDVADSYNGSGWRKKNPEYAKNLGKYYDQFK